MVMEKSSKIELTQADLEEYRAGKVSPRVEQLFAVNSIKELEKIIEAEEYNLKPQPVVFHDKAAY